MKSENPRNFSRMIRWKCLLGIFVNECGLEGVIENKMTDRFPDKLQFENVMYSDDEWKIYVLYKFKDIFKTYVRCLKSSLRVLFCYISFVVRVGN